MGAANLLARLGAAFYFLAKDRAPSHADQRRDQALGKTFASLKDNPDLSTPSGRLISQIIGAMAESETENPGLERQLESKLPDAGSSRQSHHSEVGAQVPTRSQKLRMIANIKELRAKLKAYPFGQLGVFQ